MTHGAGLPQWGDGPAVLWDHGPGGVIPERVTVPCPCGGTVDCDVPDVARTSVLDALAPSDLARLDVREVEVTTGRALRGHLDLDTAGTIVRHDDHEVLVAIAAGELQPSRDVGVLQGVVAVEQVPTAQTTATGDDRQRAGGWLGSALVVALLVAVVAAFTWFHVDAWERWSRQRALEAAGVVEVGRVADLRTSSAPLAAETHHVEIALPDGDTVAQYVDESTYGALDVGDQVRVGVDPDTGEAVVLGNDDPRQLVILLTLIDVGLLVLAAVAAVRQRSRSGS